MLRPKLIRLEEEDEVALQRMSILLRTSEASVVRWALRQYALYGVWRLGDSPPIIGEDLYPAHPYMGPDGREVE